MTTIRSGANLVSKTVGGTAGGIVGGTIAGGATAATGAVASTYRGIKESFAMPPTPGKVERADVEIENLKRFGLTAEKLEEAIANDDSTVKSFERLFKCKMSVVEKDGKAFLHLEGQVQREVLPENATKTQKVVEALKAFAKSGVGKTLLFGVGGAGLAAFLMSPAGWPVLGAIAVKLGLTGIMGGAVLGAGTRVACNVAKHAAAWTLLAVVIAGVGAFGGAVVGSRLIRVNPNPALKKIEDLPPDIQQILRESGALEIGKSKSATKIKQLDGEIQTVIRDNEYSLRGKEDAPFWVERKVQAAARRVDHLPEEIRAILTNAGVGDVTYVHDLPRAFRRPMERVEFYLKDGLKVPDFAVSDVRDMAQRLA